MQDIKILLVEDETDILNLLKYNFQSQGYSTLTAQNGNQAIEMVEDHHPDAIVLDLMLPGKSGEEVARVLKNKESTKHIPIIMLTAKGEEEDRITGLEIGADDYMVKPFSPRELMLRVQAVLKRSEYMERNSSDQWEREGLLVQFDTYQVFIQGEEVECTRTEFDLLASLVRSEGRVLTRENLLDKVWGYDFEGFARTVDTHMHRLRHKLGAYSDWIKTVRGIGYRLKRQ